MNSKIFIISHQNTTICPSEHFPILYVGSNVSSQEKQDNVYLDNSGDNISNENDVFNEMSGIYWAWKHYDEIGDPDYVGFMHYRRLFLFKESKYAYFVSQALEQDISKQIGYNENLLQDVDFILPTPYKRACVQKSYEIAHHKEDIPLALEIIKELYPQDLNIANEYFRGQSIYFNNMFIFKKEQFFEYCNWIFPILFAFKERSEFKTDRLFISEMLTGIFFRKLLARGLKAKNYPILFIEGKRLSFRESINLAKANLKSKNYGFIYSLKPIIQFFIPKSLWIRRQRKAAKTL